MSSISTVAHDERYSAWRTIRSRVVEVHRHIERASARERILQSLVHIEVEDIAELVLLAVSVGFNAGREIRCVVAAEARLSERAEDVAQALVAEEIDCLVGEIELNAFRCAVGEAAGPRERLMTRRHLWRRFEIQVSLGCQLLNETVEQLARACPPILCCRRRAVLRAARA